MEISIRYTGTCAFECRRRIIPSSLGHGRADTRVEEGVALIDSNFYDEGSFLCDHPVYYMAIA